MSENENERKLEETVVEKENPLKEMFVQYVGQKLNPENNEVTVEMCVETLAEEFPDFLLLVAQENFIRGYKQCLADMEQVSNEQKTE
jgi:hypothetical protein